jgi:hypothetical protein
MNDPLAVETGLQWLLTDETGIDILIEYKDFEGYFFETVNIVLTIQLNEHLAGFFEDLDLFLHFNHAKYNRVFYTYIPQITRDLILFFCLGASFKT